MTDHVPRKLNRAPGAVTALARQIDLAPAWNNVLATVERRRRRRRVTRTATALVAVLIVVGSIAYTLRGSHATTVRVTTSNSETVPTSCTLPPLPSPGSIPGGLSGPAVDVLRGRAALSSLELDGGLFRIDPPDTSPMITANEAECAALASRESLGPWIQYLAGANGGAAIGYGLVSIAPRLVEQANETPFAEGQINENTHPVLPRASQYRRRLAWVVVVDNTQMVGGGPNTPSPSPSLPNAKANGGNNYNYAVFVVDALTGSDALIYTEPSSLTRPAAIVVPPESVSVPWTLVSREPGGYSGTIEATVLPCDGVPNPVSVEQAHSDVAVVVERPVGASCGSPKHVRLVLHASIVTGDLPRQIEHAPLGPFVGTVPVGLNSPAGNDGRALFHVGDADNGRTLRIAVGSVIAITPLYGHGVKDNAPNTVVSSAPAVLGPISDPASEVGEFRAWRVGHVDLRLTECTQGPAGGSACTSPWVVHVAVT